MTALLLLTERFPPDMGGVARSAGRIATALSALDLHVTVVTWSRYLSPGELSPPEALAMGQISVYRLGLYRHWDMTLPQTLNVLDWLYETLSLDLVWGHYLFPAGFLAVYFAKLRELPAIVSARGNDIDRVMFPPGDFARLQWTLANASEITAVSQDMIHKIAVLSDRNAKLHNNVVDTKIFCANQAQTEKSRLKSLLAIDDSEVVLGFSGEFREKKGQQFLLQALLQVQALRPACLLIIGELRPESQTLLQTLRHQHPEAAARVVVTGHLETPEQVAQHLQLCDVYLQPSLWEGLPNALLEAMACGCICIASDAGGIPDVITPGKQGFLLPRSQLHRLGEVVLEVLCLPATKQQQLSIEARSHIHQHYSLSQEQMFLKRLLTEIGVIT